MYCVSYMLEYITYEMLHNMCHMLYTTHDICCVLYSMLYNAHWALYISVYVRYILRLRYCRVIFHILDVRLYMLDVRRWVNILGAG